jgi:hypothetical protein
MTSARICGIAFPKNDALTLFEAFAADKSAISPKITVKKFLPAGLCEHQRDANSHDCSRLLFRELRGGRQEARNHNSHYPCPFTYFWRAGPIPEAGDGFS